MTGQSVFHKYKPTHTYIHTHTNAYTRTLGHAHTQTRSETQKHRKWVCRDFKGHMLVVGVSPRHQSLLVIVVNFSERPTKRKWEVQRLTCIHIQSADVCNNKGLSTFFFLLPSGSFSNMQTLSFTSVCALLTSLCLEAAFFICLYISLCKANELFPQPSSKQVK